ncbi:MAG: hypothetical protein AB2776_19425 [Candidatus Thiodiazotropha endolucinida]
MIKLSEDGRYFVEIKDWEELLTRPGFIQKVDSDEVKIGRIIGQYNISPKEPCGIKSCGTKHNRGYLIVLSNGYETNIGNVCGKRIFKVDFTQHLNVFKKDMNTQRYREEIAATQNRIPDLDKRIRELSEGENKADWCYSQMHAQMTRLFPDNISKPLTERSKRSNSMLTRDVAITDDERESGAAGQGAKYTTENVYIIAGITAVTTYKKLRTILQTQLGTELKAFQQIDPSSESYEDLQRWHNWINKIEIRLKEVQEIIEECNRFLQPDNITNIRNYRSYL